MLQLIHYTFHYQYQKYLSYSKHITLNHEQVIYTMADISVDYVMLQGSQFTIAISKLYETNLKFIQQVLRV